jgi:hypothetical protein
MRTLISYSVVVLLAFVLASCNSSNKAGDKKGTVHIFKAEDMELDGYEINSDGTRTFIKLTEPVGVASFTFHFPSGHYDIDVSYLAESVGQNVYTMYIADNQIVAWLGKPIDDQWHMLSDQRWHVPRHIEINKGDEVRVEALSENGSMVIFDYIQFAPSGRVVAAPDSETSSQSAAQTAIEILSSPNDYITVYPEEYEHAFRNPLKGFRPGSLEHEYGTLTKTYIKWNDLENNVGDGVDKIIEASNKIWEGFEKRNLKAIPRVYLDWPRREGSWPEDMKEGDYTSEHFKERVLNMIKKLGEAWDNDPRVAYVEMGLIGYWGEQEFPDTKDEIKDAIAAQFEASFQNKLVMIRWPNTYNDHIYNFGYYWDSFAHHDQDYYAFHLNKTSPKWKTAVIGGETAYDWGNKNIQPGESPNVTLTTPVHRDYIIDRIRKLHANHVGWIANYDNNDERVRLGADLVQKALGYRFVLTEVSYQKNIRSDEKFTFSFKVKNTGSTPFYYNWPIEVSLLDPVSKEPVWRQQCTDIDIRTWLPGDQWDDSTKKYTIPAEIYTINQSMTLSDVPQGGYIFTLAILDPAGYLPSARFAVKNYFNGGRHPIGKVGVNKVIDSYSVAGFDDIQKDNALFYVLPDN